MLSQIQVQDDCQIRSVKTSPLMACIILIFDFLADLQFGLKRKGPKRIDGNSIDMGAGNMSRRLEILMILSSGLNIVMEQPNELVFLELRSRKAVLVIVLSLRLLCKFQLSTKFFVDLNEPLCEIVSSWDC